MHDQMVLPDPFCSTTASAAMFSDNRAIDTPKLLVDRVYVNMRCSQELQNLVQGTVGVPTIEPTVDRYPMDRFLPASLATENLFAISTGWHP